MGDGTITYVTKVLYLIVLLGSEILLCLQRQEASNFFGIRLIYHESCRAYGLYFNDTYESIIFLGLRGAMSFALAIRNTVSEARQAMLTTTSLIVIATVVLQGGAATHALAYLRIPTGYVLKNFNLTMTTINAVLGLNFQRNLMLNYRA